MSPDSSTTRYFLCFRKDRANLGGGGGRGGINALYVMVKMH